jgi:hypothetical protein
MASHKITGLSAGTTAGDSVEYAGSPSFTNLAYTGTLTGSTGILNIGSGQVYKDASGNVGIGTSSPTGRISVVGSDAGSLARIDTSNGTVKCEMISYSGLGYYGTTTSHPVVIQTAGTEKMRIDSSGNVGIGTSSSNCTLTLNGAGATGGQIAIQKSGTLQGNIYGTGTELRIENTSSTPIVFIQNTGAEYMRIDSSGNVGIGTTTQRNGTKTTIEQAGNLLGLSCSSNLASVDFALFYANAGTICGAISRVGATSAVVYTATSDYRLKENVQPFINALETVAKLNPVTYVWKDCGIAANGFIAHELQEVCPDAVVGTKDEIDADGNPKYQSIDQSKIVALLTKAIQEQQTLIEALTARLTALEAK